MESKTLKKCTPAERARIKTTTIPGMGPRDLGYIVAEEPRRLADEFARRNWIDHGVQVVKIEDIDADWVRVTLRMPNMRPKILVGPRHFTRRARVWLKVDEWREKFAEPFFRRLTWPR